MANMTEQEQFGNVNIWHVTLWEHEEDDSLTKVRPYEYLVALPKTQVLGDEIAVRQIIEGGMLPDHVYIRGEDIRTVDPRFSVDASIVEWERPGNIGRLF